MAPTVTPLIAKSAPVVPDTIADVPVEFTTAAAWMPVVEEYRLISLARVPRPFSALLLPWMETVFRVSFWPVILLVSVSCRYPPSGLARVRSALLTWPILVHSAQPTDTPTVWLAFAPNWKDLLENAPESSFWPLKEVFWAMLS